MHKQQNPTMPRHEAQGEHVAAMRIPVPVRALAFLSGSEGMIFEDRAQRYSEEEKDGEREYCDTRSDADGRMLSI
jgi:hypothetical protein